MKLLNDGPLTDAEVEQLDLFLLEAEGIDEAMDLSTRDGFLTAILCGPKTIMPSEWLSWVWDMERGDDAPVVEAFLLHGSCRAQPGAGSCRPHACRVCGRCATCTDRAVRWRWARTGRRQGTLRPGVCATKGRPASVNAPIPQHNSASFTTLSP